MFKKHPQALLPAILVNMFTRFAFFMLMSLFVFFLPAKVGLASEKTGIFYSIFYFSIFIFTLVGGVVADKIRNYKGTIFKGLILMAIGYLIIAIPIPSGRSGVSLVIYIALFLIAFGYGLFNGNIYAMLGQMYDAPGYSQRRDSGFLLSNLFVNVGALLAPLAAVGIRNYCISGKGFIYNPDIPRLCHEYSANGENVVNYERFKDMAAMSGQGTMEISEFVTQYLHAFSRGFSYAFALAVVAMAISLIIFFRNKNKFPIPVKLEAQTPKMNSKRIRQRVYAFLAVFGILNLFCVALYQDAYTLTFFIKDYTELWRLGFDFSKVSTCFTILATPIVLLFFSILRAKGKEPSTLKKMAIGMGIAAVAYLVMALGSIGLPDRTGVIVFSETQRVIPILFSTFFILAVAELFVYPLLNSFVSQFARPKHQGIMQSVCMFARSIGNLLLFLSVTMYKHVPVWAIWLIFATICLVSMIMLLSMLKWVEKRLVRE